MAANPNAVPYNLSASFNEIIAPAQLRLEEETICTPCGTVLPGRLKFCTHCGQPLKKSAAPSAPITTPTFAEVPSHKKRPGSKNLEQEMGKLFVELARQRFFLYMHWLIFLGVHSLGFMLAYDLYLNFVGDQTTRACLALVPFAFLNAGAFLSLHPIKTTRMEISRIKEQLTYLHFQIEYQDLW